VNNHKIYIAGGGDKEQSRHIDQELASHFETRNTKPTCLYVPLAMDRHQHGEAYDWFSDAYGEMFDSIVLPDDLANVSQSPERFDVIYMGGGNTGKLLDRIYESNFNKYITDHLAQGGLVYGGSAGAVVLGRTILTVPEAEHSASNNHGLNLLGNKSVVPHYVDSVDRQRVDALCHRLGTDIIALPENSGLVLDSATGMHAVGSDAVYEFRTDGSIIQI
jgi:dipeptidase E